MTRKYTETTARFIWPAVAAVVTSLLVGEAVAFSIPRTPTAISLSRTREATCLHLLPEQGSQLAAAWNAACSQKQHDKEHHGSNTTNASATASPPSAREQALSAARAFASAVFSLPSSLLHPHDKSEDEYKSVLAPLTAAEQRKYSNNGDDVVLYPIVGFRMVPTTSTEKAGSSGSEIYSLEGLQAKGSTSTTTTTTTTVVRALPTKSHMACRIPLQEQQDEVLAGWFSPACRIPVELETTVKNFYETKKTMKGHQEESEEGPEQQPPLSPAFAP